MEWFVISLWTSARPGDSEAARTMALSSELTLTIGKICVVSFYISQSVWKEPAGCLFRRAVGGLRSVADKIAVPFRTFID